MSDETKVWLVFGGEYEQWFPAGVFSSLEKARAWANKNKGYYVYDDAPEIVDDPARD